MKWIKAFRAAFAGKKTNHTGADYKIVVAPLEGWSQASYKAVADMVDTLGGMAYQNTKASCARQPGEFLPFPASKLSCGIETEWRYNINHNQNDNFAGIPAAAKWIVDNGGGGMFSWRLDNDGWVDTCKDKGCPPCPKYTGATAMYDALVTAGE